MTQDKEYGSSGRAGIGIALLSLSPLLIASFGLLPAFGAAAMGVLTLASDVRACPIGRLFAAAALAAGCTGVAIGLRPHPTLPSYQQAYRSLTQKVATQLAQPGELSPVTETYASPAMVGWGFTESKMAAEAVRDTETGDCATLYIKEATRSLSGTPVCLQGAKRPAGFENATHIPRPTTHEAISGLKAN